MKWTSEMLAPKNLQSMVGGCPWGADYGQWNMRQLRSGLDHADELPTRDALHAEIQRRKRQQNNAN